MPHPKHQGLGQDKIDKIYNIIKEEENKLKKDLLASEAINIIFNLIKLKECLGTDKSHYKDIKIFLEYNVNLIKIGDYGYDNFNYNKINTVLKLLSFSEQYTILQYAISLITRELPEYDLEWFVQKKHVSEIKHIIHKREICLYPKAILLFTGMNLWRLILSLICFFIFVNILTLPSPYESMALFEITYDSYSNIFIINHILNILTLFSGTSGDDFRILPFNWFGVVILSIGKIFFITLIINFIYVRISEKISLK